MDTLVLISCGLKPAYSIGNKLKFVNIQNPKAKRKSGDFLKTAKTSWFSLSSKWAGILQT